MTEQRLQEMEHRTRGPEGAYDMHVYALIAEVRRLQQERDKLHMQVSGECYVEECCCDVLTKERDAALAERDSSGAHLRETILELRMANESIDIVNSQVESLEHDLRAVSTNYARAQVRRQEAEAALTTALAERDEADEALAACQSQGYSAIANLYALCQRMNRQKTDAQRDELMSHATRIASQAGIPTGVMAMLRDAVPTDAPTLVKERDSAIAERDAALDMVAEIGQPLGALSMPQIHRNADVVKALRQREIAAKAALTEARAEAADIRDSRDFIYGQLVEARRVLWMIRELFPDTGTPDPDHSVALYYGQARKLLAAVLAQEEK